MPTPKRGPRLAGGPAQQQSMLRNQATELFRHGRIRTTESRAKLLRPYAEKLITKAKAGDLHKRRQVLSELRDRDVVAYLFEEIGPRFADRNGGYTRILKLGPRPGDNARMAIIELVDRGTGESGHEAIEESKGRRSRGLFGRRRRGGDDTVERAEEVGQGLATAVTDAVEDATEAVVRPRRGRRRRQQLRHRRDGRRDRLRRRRDRRRGRREGPGVRRGRPGRR